MKHPSITYMTLRRDHRKDAIKGGIFVMGLFALVGTSIFLTL